MTLENIRAMPWEKNRRPPKKPVAHGTYGIGGARMLNCTFRNLTAEAGWVAWGVFGTNLNKNFRLENCRLNRVDVHFHCWNLYLTNCSIGFKGISVTGGGDLFIEDTTRHGNNFIGFRSDYGSKWDGRIRLRGCTLRPTSAGGVSVLSYAMRNFDYKYPIGFARSVDLEDLVIDYSAAPDSTSPCWLMGVVPFSKTGTGQRLFFPNRLAFRDVRVVGREQGVRLFRLLNPHHFDLGRPGGYDGAQLTANSQWTFDNVQLEKLTPKQPGDPDQVHLLIGGQEAVEYADGNALFPQIRFTDCNDVSLLLGNCAANATFERCTLNTIWAPGLQRGLSFTDCHFQSNVQEAPGDLCSLDSTLGTRFTNCTVHAPAIGGKPDPGAVSRTGFLELNKSVRHYHVNTALGNAVPRHLEDSGTKLDPGFLSELKLHHGMEE